VTLFRRRKPLHVRLAESAGLGEPAPTPTPGLAAEPPGWDGEQRGEAGIHGVARSRRWDVVTTADVAGLRGDEVRFVGLNDGSLLSEEDEPDKALAALAEAVETRLPRPYRAEAVRRGPEQWAVAASRIAVVELPGVHGDEAELVVTGGERTLRVDGRPTMRTVPELALAGEAVAQEYVVRARRLDGSLWEVEASPL
jgi:hypothetical protein